MNEETTISIARDFSRVPGGRYPSDGEYCGERFRDEILIPALEKFGHVRIDLDGTFGFGSSFLEEAFGGLVRRGVDASDLHKRLEILSEDKSYKVEIWQYIDEGALQLS